jgi:mono/diheme cytochrome c family protein
VSRGRPREAPFAAWPVVAAVLLLSPLGLATAEPAERGDDVERGRALYVERCAHCHGADGRGGGVDARRFDAAPVDLAGSALLANNSNERLAARILNGPGYWLESYRTRVVPAYTPRTDAIERFLRRLPQVKWDDVDAGEKLYRARCVGCHGSFGAERLPRASASTEDDRRFASVADDRELARLARHDAPGMPGLQPPLGLAESAKVAMFLRLLSPGYELYERHCVACHGRHGRSDWLKFDERYFQKLAPGELRERIWYMLRGLQESMPHFEGTLSRAEVENILVYLRSIAARGSR